MTEKEDSHNVNKNIRDAAIRKLIAENDNESVGSNDNESDKSQSDSEDPGESEEAVIYKGLLLNKKYVLLDQVGAGSFSTVWLAYCFKEKKYFAIKIIGVDHYNLAVDEVNFYKKIATKSNTPGSKYLMRMTESFSYVSSEGKHACIVFDLMAGSLATFLDTGKYKYGFSVPIVKRITKQLLLGMKFLNYEMKLIHTDLKPENVLLEGINNQTLNVISEFENTNFQENVDSLIEQFAKKKNKDQLYQQITDLALLTVEQIELARLRDQLGGDDTEDESEDESDESVDAILSVDDESDTSSEMESDEESDTSDESSSESNDEKLNKRRKKKLNSRTQSIDDFEDYLGEEPKDVDLDELEDWNEVLNNRVNSKDKVALVDDKYISACQVRISDFGNVCSVFEKEKDEIQTRHYRAPEIILDCNYNASCDVWSLGCIIFELLTGYVLFHPTKKPLNKDTQQLYMMEKLLGKIPTRLIAGSKRGKIFFDPKNNYRLRHVKPFETHPLEKRLVEQFLFTPEEAKDIMSFLGYVLVYENRPSVADCLEHPWIKNVVVD